MEATIRTLNVWAEGWFSAALHIGWQAAVLAVLVILAVRLGRRWGAPLRYALLLVALVKFVVPPTLSSSTGLFTLAGPAVRATDVVLDPSDALLLEGPRVSLPSSTKELAGGTGVTGVTGSVAAAPAPVASPSVASASTDYVLPASSADSAGRPIGGLSWKAVLMLLHALGVLLGVLWLVRQGYALRRLERSSRVVRSGPLHDALERVSRALGLARVPRLLVAREAGPAAFGLLRPRVVVPHVVGALSTSEQEAVLAHEVAHHRRRDVWVLWAQTLVQVVWWFHPAVWALGRSLRATREECCDDLLLSSGITTDENYCNTLLRTASFMAIAREPALAAGMTRPLLARRFRRIMDGTAHRAKGLSRASLCLVAALAFLALPGLNRESSDRGQSSDAGARAQSESVAVRGRVLAPNGEPAAGVEVFLASSLRWDEISGWTRLGTSSSDGSFVFELSSEQMRAVYAYYRVLIAVAPGYGPAWVKVEDEPAPSHDLQLAEEFAIRGRVIDLEGRPVQGARVRLYQALDTKERSLDTWLEAARADPDADSGRKHLRMPVNLNQPGHDEPALTDENGRFALRGAGAEQVTRLIVEGDTIATDEISVVGRDVPTFVASWWGGTARTYHAPEFEYIAAPTRAVVGRILDLDTGEGIEGAIVTCVGGPATRHLRTTSDAEGRYRLVGLPKEDGCWVRVEESLETGYAAGDAPLPNPPGLEPIEQDVQLLSGVIANVTITEAGNGAPVEGAGVFYLPAGSNQNARSRIRSFSNQLQTDAEGRARLLVLPGEGTLGVWAGTGYLTLSELEEPVDLGEATMVRLSTQRLQAVQSIAPEAGTATIDVALEVVRGDGVGVDLVDARGEPVEGAHVFGLEQPLLWAGDAASGSRVVLASFNAERPRVVLAVHPELELVGTYDRKAGTQLIEMAPGGEIVGRLLDEDDLPFDGATLLVEFVAPGEDEYVRFKPTHVTTGEDGSFRIAPVLPGARYRIGVSEDFMMSSAQALVSDLAVRAGETLDVGSLSAKRE